LMGLKERFEKHHSVKYSAEAITAAVTLSKKYFHERFLPDKAIDVIDEAGAANRLLPKSKRKSVLNEKDIESLVSRQANIPEQSVSINQKERLQNLDRDIKIMIFGQDEAVAHVTAVIKLQKSGLSNGERPIGAFLFAGPTGVGKTELAKQLAQSLGIHFMRYDMSEYMEKHSVSRLIGSPPGYVGFDQGGLLTDAINKHPHSVILLDEVEKAHHDIYNILLQVFDYGFLTDNNGRKADFRNAVVIMTTNAGAFEQSQNTLGLGSTGPRGRGESTAAIKRIFSPEFLSRLDSIVQFNSLDQANILRVVDKFLIELEQQLAAKSVVITADQQVREWLAKKGYDPKNGARPIYRLIQSKIKTPLVEELLFGKLEHGGKVVVRLEQDELKFEITRASTKKLVKPQKPSKKVPKQRTTTTTKSKKKR